jgi:drug/metabolite transporter (DMT)-like permease
MQKISRTAAEMVLLGLTVIWGSTFALTKLILENASPFVYISIRFSIASAIFFLLFHKQIKNMRGGALFRGSVLGILLFFGFVLQTVGLKYTTASKSAFITGLTVIFVPLLQLVIQKRGTKKGNIIGILLVAAGLYFMTSPSGSGFNTGDSLTLLCAVLFGIYIVYLDEFSKVESPAYLTFLQLLVTAVLALCAIPFLETPFLSINHSFLWNIGYLAVLPTIVALYLMAKYQKFSTPARSAIIYSMEPPMAAIFAFFFIGERLGSLEIMGGFLIFSGLVVSELSDYIFKGAGSGS